MRCAGCDMSISETYLEDPATFQLIAEPAQMNIVPTIAYPIAHHQATLIAGHGRCLEVFIDVLSMLR